MIVELVKFFDKYPLSDCTLRKQARFFFVLRSAEKKGDYLLFKQIISIMQLKEHLTPSGQKEGFTTKRL
jgi:hypothetical protein